MAAPRRASRQEAVGAVAHLHKGPRGVKHCFLFLSDVITVDPRYAASWLEACSRPVQWPASEFPPKPPRVPAKPSVALRVASRPDMIDGALEFDPQSAWHVGRLNEGKNHSQTQEQETSSTPRSHLLPEASACEIRCSPFPPPVKGLTARVPGTPCSVAFLNSTMPDTFSP
jgi:hypothetical protein